MKNSLISKKKIDQQMCNHLNGFLQKLSLRDREMRQSSSTFTIVMGSDDPC